MKPHETIKPTYTRQYFDQYLESKGVSPKYEQDANLSVIAVLSESYTPGFMQIRPRAFLHISH